MVFPFSTVDFTLFNSNTSSLGHRVACRPKEVNTIYELGNWLDSKQKLLGPNTTTNAIAWLVAVLLAFTPSSLERLEQHSYGSFVRVVVIHINHNRALMN